MKPLENIEGYEKLRQKILRSNNLDELKGYEGQIELDLEIAKTRKIIKIEDKHFDVAYAKDGETFWGEQKNINWEKISTEEINKIKTQAMKMKMKAEAQNAKIEVQSTTEIPQDLRDWFLSKGFKVKDPTGVYEP